LLSENDSSVTEQSGRTVNYTYDNLYRLTNETVALDPANVNGAVNYTYDAVGNRKQMASTLPGVAAGLWNYDANDRFTAGDTYDANGNTISSGGIGNVYDFENRLIQKGGVTIVYDGDGNRVAKTVAGVTTRYLVDVKNPTGYAQVIAEEFANTTNSATYIYGLERIARGYYSSQFGGVQGFRYYLYDGHGSVRALADTSGNVTDTYDYDAFGNLLHSASTTCSNSAGAISTVALGAACPAGSSPSPTPNNYLYSGEQFDPDLHLYYNRARYLNVSTGRFWTMDTFEGRSQDPISLHKYLYVGADPINRVDPRGKDFIDSIAAVAVSATIFAASVPQLLSEAFEEGGTAVGVLFNEFGQVAENYAGQVLALVEDEIGEIEILQQQNVGGRVVDFVVRNAEAAKQMFIEVKYGFPSTAEALSRLVAQVQAASQAAQQGGGQVVLWTLRSLTPSQLQTLESELQNTNVQVLSGVEALGKAVLSYFQ
jgi:RHS repeat-associated protein